MPHIKLSLSQSEWHHTAHRIPHRVEGHLDQDLEIRDQKFKGELSLNKAMELHGHMWAPMSQVMDNLCHKQSKLSTKEICKGCRETLWQILVLSGRSHFLLI